MNLLEILNHFWLTLFLLLPVVLISRSVVAGSKYSPILIIVIFGLSLGVILDVTGIGTPGLPEFPVVGLAGGLTVTALVVTFFVGGQKLRNTFFTPKHPKEDDVILNKKEVVLGTQGTQLVFLVRAFFILLGIEGIKRIVLGTSDGDILSVAYPLIAFFGLAGSIILIDSKAKIVNKQKYMIRGVVEIVTIILVLIVSFYVSRFFATGTFFGLFELPSLPQIFFAMIISSSLGMYFSNWRPGPTMRALLFGGIPMVLAAVFIVGGTRLLSAFQTAGMLQVMSYGFFGQLFWMFGGLAILVFLANSNKVDILAPGMAGSLSHSGLTGACTAGDLGEVAAERAPIMINVPFVGHLFVFTILAFSADRGNLLVGPGLLVVTIGVFFTVWAVKTLRNANNEEAKEIKGLILFSLGWQLVAVFGGFTLLHFAGFTLSNAAMANSSAISHFGLFAATLNGMFGAEAQALITFIFAMPFLIHPLVFGMFGRAMTKNGEMPRKALATLAIIGILGVLFSLVVL